MDKTMTKYIGEFWLDGRSVLFYVDANDYENAKSKLFSQVAKEYCLSVEEVKRFSSYYISKDPFYT